MTDQAPELLPCPLCKAEGHTLIRGFVYPEGSSIREGAIWCPTCDCRAPLKSWNTRPTPAERCFVDRKGRGLMDDDCEDQALVPTKHCTKCRPAFVAGNPVYPQLVKRGRFWCCVACGSSYGENPHPEIAKGEGE